MDTLPTEQDTKSLLLDCADRLFLAKGYDGVSIRSITDAAGANVAAINYHFGGKPNLYRAVLARRFNVLARTKVAQIEGLMRDLQQPTLREILAAHVRSHFEELLGDPDAERLLMIIYREMSPDAVAADLVIDDLVTPIHRALIGAIRTVCPELTELHVSRCISSMTGQILHFIRFRQIVKKIHEIDTDADFIDMAIRHITDFSLQGFRSTPHDED